MEPTLVIMAAGMGSRFGGLKQIEPITKEGEVILDFSLFDAKEAGFNKVVFIIKKEIEDDFKRMIEGKAGKYLEVKYAFQDINNLPEGYSAPAGRKKPWGTAHAVLSAIDDIEGPFAVINADDYYGKGGFVSMYDFLSSAKNDHKYNFCMIGYELSKTITENGHVARGVCKVDSEGFLQDITEHTKIIQDGNKIISIIDEKSTKEELDSSTVVSMNFWGFTKEMLEEMAKQFPVFLDDALINNPEKAEFYLPKAVDELLNSNKARVKVMKSEEKWYGVTYMEDKDSVVEAISKMKDEGIYPDKLWV